MAPYTSPPAQNGEREVLLYFTTDPQGMRRRLIRFYDSFVHSGDNFDFAIISFVKNGATNVIEHDFNGRKILQYVYGSDSIQNLGYPNKGSANPFKLIPGNCDLPVLLFWRANRQYQRYWVMEDDVEYSGDPTRFFKSLKGMDGDLLATHLALWFPEWDYSSKFRSGAQRLPVDNMWLCFLPFFVVKDFALSVIDQCYRDGWDGHHEMTWPTMLKLSGCSVVDIGGAGPFVAAENRNKYYIGGGEPKFQKSGSFGTLNVRLFPGKQNAVLWHPVKPFRAWLRQSIKRFRSVLAWIVKRKLVSLITPAKSRI